MYTFTQQLETAIKECARLNWRLVAIKPQSHLDGDSHLCIVLSQRKERDTYTYQTHACNCESGGLFWGHYDLTLETGIADFNKRGSE